MMTKENAVDLYFREVICHSWTWERLTVEEKTRFENMNVFSRIKGNAQQRIDWLNTVYHAFLTALGYSPINWREPEPETVPF